MDFNIERFTLKEVMDRIQEGESYESNSIIISLNEGMICMKSKDEGKSIMVGPNDRIFAKVYTLCEVLANPNLSVRVLHPLVDLESIEFDTKFSDQPLIEVLGEKYVEGQYLPIDELMLILSWHYNSHDLSLILKEGRWITI